MTRNNQEPLLPGRYFHIFNRGTNSCDIFFTPDDFNCFFELVSIFILPVAEIHAWCLMKNHVHFLVKTKDESEIGYLDPKYKDCEDLSIKWKTYFPIEKQNSLKHIPNTFFSSDPEILSWRKPVAEKQFGHLFGTFAKKMNLKYKRTGSLFEHTLRRILIDNEGYLLNVVRYIHHNPVKHRIVKQTTDYVWTSYHSFMSQRQTKLQRDKTLFWFKGLDQFTSYHEKQEDDEYAKAYFIEND